jgi:hypothetical protein
MDRKSLKLKLITFSCPDCETGTCYLSLILPYTFKCDHCGTEHFISEDSIKLLKKTKLLSFSSKRKPSDTQNNNSLPYM